MRIKNKFIDRNNIENVTFLTRSSISAIRQMRVGEPVYICTSNFSPSISDSKVN